MSAEATTMIESLYTSSKSSFCDHQQHMIAVRVQAPQSWESFNVLLQVFELQVIIIIKIIVFSKTNFYWPK